ncbi:WD40 repeat-like protein [Hesseltinella vesiculosa]|uniref:WD40 repeat-like protein n=1 Tax=Hesseltinella vesiculosa TaxID=101127 RepID=A0A1X2GWI5_9FUNG|nr:WD40 repeat-like protein [Hesseltinella vesiculosa]
MVEAQDTSCVYGLRQQARSLTPVAASTEKSKFLLGSLGTKNNVVCLLEYDDDQHTTSSILFAHPDEVWDIASCPANEDLFMTCHSPVSVRPSVKQATLWKKTQQDRAGSLESLLTLDYAAEKAWWNSDGQSLIAIDKATLYHTHIDHTSASTPLMITTDCMFDTTTSLSTSLPTLQNATWNPHKPEVVTVGGQSIAGWDLRAGTNTFLRRQAHASTIRALDCNANKPYHLATGGDDAKVRLWDTRQLTEPLTTLENHTHWVWSVAFNKFYDQVLLTSSSDTLVQLQNVVSASSASYLEHESSDSEGEHEADHKQVDGLMATFEQHEDSVYSVAWSPADTWTFASLSYAGRVVISQVPTQEKFKILGV